MGEILRKPVTIAVIVAVVSSGVLFVTNHTDLLSRLPTAPPGTTLHTAHDAGAEVVPTEIDSPIKPEPPGPAPAHPTDAVR